MKAEKYSWPPPSDGGNPFAAGASTGAGLRGNAAGTGAAARGNAFANKYAGGWGELAADDAPPPPDASVEELQRRTAKHQSAIESSLARSVRMAEGCEAGRGRFSVGDGLVTFWL